MTTPIPQPPGLPLIGNVLDLDPENAIVSLTHLAKQYGPIFKLNLLGRQVYFVSSVALVNELCDEKRFCKSVTGALQELRPGIGDGLFTAHHGEHNWGVAHRVLVPAFGPLSIQNMYDEMYDIATQLVAKWARKGPQETINVTDDYTRLTLDSIALCAMDKRFNSFYSEDLHPFVGAMVDFLIEGGRRPRRTRLESLINTAPARKYAKDIELMKSVAAEVIAYRRANPSDKKDLLNALLFGKDPKTGERMTDENIMCNMITFLVAGHETTAGLLSFTTYFLLKNPDSLQKAQDEVDRVVGSGPVKFEHISKLPYIEAVLREALRLQPTAPAFTIKALPETKEPVILGGEYLIPQDASLTCILPAIHRDPAVYGSDAEEFKPERMYGENFTNLPPNSWKPFGNGARGCIGRPFAWQEAILTLALVLQNFNLRMEDPSYQLHLKSTLTIKPANFHMKATLRSGIDPIMLEKRMFSGLQESMRTEAKSEKAPVHLEGGKPMTILFGSNSGTCEGLAQKLAASAGMHGYSATVKTLDEAKDQFPTGQPVVVVSASYEGNPPDNAALFVEWLKAAPSSNFQNARVAVFGCGHRDWVATYQKIPILIESEVKAKGAKILVSRGESNVAAGTVFDDFDAWTDKLWPSIGGNAEANDIIGLDMEMTTNSRASHLNHNVQDAVVLKNELLTATGVPEKRHVQIRLPTNVTYDAGDYLAVLPINNVPTISRVLRRFGLPWDTMMTLKKGAHTTIPTETELSVAVVLGAYVELTAPATKKNLATLSKLAGEDAKDLPTTTDSSLLDILEQHPQIKLPFAVYLSMLNPMRIRQYSISSSPLADPTIASITYSVIDSDGRLGVATNYLRDLKPGSTIQVTVKKSHASFHLPLDDDTTPVIMVGAGTGLAPFHGFVQERSVKLAAGKKLAEAVLFIGCRSPDQDKIYAEELADWEKQGAVKLYYAFSRASDQSEGCKYVQDRLLKEREVVNKLFDANARAYICGSSSVGKGVAEVAAVLCVDKAKERGKEMTHEEGLKWWEGLRGERYAVDVFD